MVIMIIMTSSSELKYDLLDKLLGALIFAPKSKQEGTKVFHSREKKLNLILIL